MIEAWTAAASGRSLELAEADVVSAFDAVKIVDPATGEEGAVELDVLKLWRTTGIGGHAIGAFAGGGDRRPRARAHGRRALRRPLHRAPAPAPRPGAGGLGLDGPARRPGRARFLGRPRRRCRRLRRSRPDGRHLGRAPAAHLVLLGALLRRGLLHHQLRLPGRRPLAGRASTSRRSNATSRSSLPEARGERARGSLHRRRPPARAGRPERSRSATSTATARALADVLASAARRVLRDEPGRVADRPGAARRSPTAPTCSRSSSTGRTGSPRTSSMPRAACASARLPTTSSSSAAAASSGCPPPRPTGSLAVHVSNGRGIKGLVVQGLVARFGAAFPELRLAIERLADPDALREAVAADRIEKLRLVRLEPAGERPAERDREVGRSRRRRRESSSTSRSGRPATGSSAR